MLMKHCCKLQNNARELTSIAGALNKEKTDVIFSVCAGDSAECLIFSYYTMCGFNYEMNNVSVSDASPSYTTLEGRCLHRYRKHGVALAARARTNECARSIYLDILARISLKHLFYKLI